MSAVQVQGLNFSFGEEPILNNLNFTLKKGARCLLVGANGAGKSTLLRILAGKTLVKGNSVRILDKNPFTDGSIGITYLGTEWSHNPIVKRDIPVSRLLMSLGANRHQERCARLLECMGVNPNWHMHQISDGQRRRVQIVLGLMEPWDILLLDEVTVDLDVLARADLLAFLKHETESRNATIVYATHIFDGITGWATHIGHMVDGTVDFVHDLQEGFPELKELQSKQASGVFLKDSPLLMIVEEWLRRDDKALKAKPTSDSVYKTRWEILSDNMAEYGDKYYNYWR